MALRLPSLQQPAGADQALYGYVGQRILHGELPYRDAWDQKPPGIHATYAMLWAIWPDERVVPAADLVVAVATALLLLALGRRIGPPGAGEIAALIFLFLGDPAWGRLGGVRARGQCEVFIGLVSTAGLLLLHRALDAGARRVQALGFAAGALFGCAFVYKYNAGAVLIAAAFAALWWWRQEDAASLGARIRGVLPAGVAVASGFVTVVAAMLADLRLRRRVRRPVSRDHQLQRLLLGRDLRQPLRDARLPAALPDRAGPRRRPVVRRRPRLRGDPA